MISFRHLVEHLDLIEGTSTEDLKNVSEPIRPYRDPPRPLKVFPETPVRQATEIPVRPVAAIPTRQVVAPPVPPVRQMAPVPVRPQKKVEIPKKTKPQTLTKKQKEEDDVLAKVNAVIPPFSPCRERIRREEM